MRENHLSIEVCILSSAASLAALSATSSSLYLRARESHAVAGGRGGVRLVAKRDDARVQASGGNLRVEISCIHVQVKVQAGEKMRGNDVNPRETRGAREMQGEFRNGGRTNERTCVSLPIAPSKRPGWREPCIEARFSSFSALRIWRAVGTLA